MARTRTVLELEEIIRDLADCEPYPGTRHTSTMLRKHMNASWQALRAMVTDKGDPLYVKPVDVSTGVGPDTGAAYGLLAMPVASVRIQAIDLTVSATDIRELLPASFNDRNTYHQAGIRTGAPSHFSIFNIGEESGASVGNGWIALLPAPDRVYPCRIYYLPAWADITNDAYVFNGFEGWDDWVANDVVMKLAEKDNDMAATAALASQMKAEAEKRVLASCSAMQRVAPSHGRDTARQGRLERGRRRDLFR
jgi:hypothetical protein